MKFNTVLVLTISSGDKIPNCTRFTVRSGALESLIAILQQYSLNYCRLNKKKLSTRMVVCRQSTDGLTLFAITQLRLIAFTNMTETLNAVCASLCST